MKKIFNIVILAVITLSLAVSTFAQKEKSKKDLFKEITGLSQTKKPDEQRKAYELGKEYLQRFGTENDENLKVVKNYVEKYGKAARPNFFNEALDKGNYAEGFAIGKEILAEEPENVYITMNLAYAGYEALVKKNDRTFGDETIKYAKQTLAFFEANKLPKEFAPFKDKAEATSLMYYAIANFTLPKDSKEAVKNFYKAFQFESSIKTTAYPYYAIAFHFEQEYQAAATDFQTKHGAKTTEDAAMKADKEKLNIVIDRMIDAYARAVKLGEGSKNESVAGWKTRLTEIYKFRYQSETGLNELLNTVLTKPIADPSSW